MSLIESYLKKRGVSDQQLADAKTANRSVAGVGGVTQNAGLSVPKSQAQPKLSVPSQRQTASASPMMSYINKRIKGWEEEAQAAQRRLTTANNEAATKNRYLSSGQQGMPTMGMAMQQQKKDQGSVSGNAGIALDSSGSASKSNALYNDIQQFKHGEAMSADDITNYLERADELKRDASYSIAWLTNNKSRMSQPEYDRLYKQYKNQSAIADEVRSLAEYYQNGGDAALYAETPAMRQQFVDGTLDIDQPAAEVERLTNEIIDLEEQKASYTNLINGPKPDDTTGYYERQKEYRGQLRGINELLAAKYEELGIAQQRQGLYLGFVDAHRESDPSAQTKTEEGKKLYDEATKNLQSQYDADYRVTGLKPQEHTFGSKEELDSWLSYEWAENNDRDKASLVTTYNPINGSYTVRYNNLSQDYLNEGAAMLDARNANPTALSLDHMNDRQQETYYYLLGSGYEDMAISYANECAREARLKESERVSKYIEEHPNWGIPGTIAYSLLFPFAGHDILYGSGYVDTGLSVNPNLGPGGYRDAIVGGNVSALNKLSGTIGEKVPVLGGKGLGDLYSTALSGAESYGSAMAFGKFATLPLALSAASSAYNDAVARGISEDEARLTGLSAGAAEALSEFFSISRFLDGKVTSSILKDILIQGGVETSEEVLTAITNHAMDRWINRGKSQYEKDIAAYMKENNVGRDEAETAVIKKFLEDVTYEGLAAFATGTAMSAGPSIANHKNADRIIAAKGNFNVSKGDRMLAEQAYVAAGVEHSDSEQQAHRKITQWIQDGAPITMEQRMQALSNYVESENAARNKSEAEKRADAVQQGNPDSTVIRSDGTQAYLDLGLDLPSAQKAGAVLDGIVTGEITAENMTSNQARALQLNTKIGVDAVRKVLGVEIKQRANSVANGGVMAKAVAQQYEQNKAVATPVSEAQQTVQPMSEPAVVQNVDAAQAQEMPQTAQPVQHPIAQLPRPIPIRRNAPIAHQMGSSYSVQAAQTQTQQQPQTQQPYMTFDEFEANYLMSNPGATFSQVSIAYGDYLKNQSGETRQSTKTGTVGLERNEYSDQMDKAVTDAVDSLGKLFGLRIRFDDLGPDNGYYTIGTNDVVLDIAPSRKDIAKENAFRFVIAHEIGHAAKDRLGAERWQQFEDYAVKIMGGEKAITAKQQEGEAYADEAVAREDVACDFIGKLLSDKATLDNFCEAIRSGEVQKETARGFMAAVRKILGKLRGKGIKQFDAVTKQLAEKTAKQFNTELETAENAVKAMQQVLSEAARAEKNTTQEGDVLPSKKNKNTKTTAVRHADSVRHAEHGAIRMAQRSVTGSADNLGIAKSIAQETQSVKSAILVLSEIKDSIAKEAPVLGLSEATNPKNFMGALVKQGVMHRGGTSNSIYGVFGDRTLRISRHHAKASYFNTSGENLSIVVYGNKPNNLFQGNASDKVIEASFNLHELFDDSVKFQKVIEDIAHYIVGEDYHDTAGASYYSFSGGKTFELSAIYRLYDDAVSRGDEAMAGKLVEEAAKRAGYTVRAYHGSQSKFTVFDKKKARSSGAKGSGFYFSNSSSHAGHYGQTYNVYLKMNHTLRSGSDKISAVEIRKFLDAVAENEDYSIENYGTYDVGEIMQQITSRDAYAVIQDINATSIGDFTEAVKLFNEVNRTNFDSIADDLEMVVFEPEQIKSAEPVTYDNDGNVIPLSERFNEKKSDIRFSKKSGSETTAYSERYGSEMQTEGQVERAQARDTERAKVRSDEASGKNAEAVKETDQKIGDALKMKPLRRRGLASKAETEARNKAADASLQQASVERAHKAIANEASRKMEQDTAKSPDQYLQMVEIAQKQAEKIKANYDAKIKELKEQKSQLLKERRNLANRNETLTRQRKHEAKQAELERAFRADAEKENRELVRAGVSLNNRAEKAEAATRAAKEKADERVQQQKAKTEHEAKQAELERAFRKDAEKENRRLDREIGRMERQRDRMIRAIQVDALLQAEDNRQAIRAIANWRKKGLLPGNEVADIDTEIRTLQEQAKLARGDVPKSAKGKARALGRAMQEVGKQLAFEFTSDVLPFEEIGRLQSRIDSAETAVTAFKNRSSMVNAVLTDSLRAPDGSVLDVRSAEEVLGCWKNDKVGGKIDEGRQQLLDRYMYLLHNADRMSAVDNARAAMTAFLEKHPDYKVYALETLRPDGSISSKDLSYKAIDIVEAAKNGDAVASEYITLAKAFAEAKNKPVFGSEDGRGLDATVSKIIAKQMEQKNPWLKQKAEEFYGWWDKFMQSWWVGIQGTQAQYDAMKKLYPHYVPTYRAIESGLLNWASSNRSIRSKNAVQAAKGSTLDLNTVGDNVARQIQNVINSALLDKLFENVYDAVLDGTEGISQYAVAGDIGARMALENLYDDNAADPDAEFGKKLVEKMVGQDKDYYWTGHYHGEERSLVVNRMVFSALKSITNQNKGLNAISKVGNVLTKPMKTAITGVNVAFAARNIPRDFTTAMINSVAGLKYIAYYNMAIAKMFGDTGAGRMIASLMAKITNADISETSKEGIVKELVKSLENARLRGSKEWADFVALGGTSSTYARSETGFLWNKSAKGWLRNAKNTALEWLGSFNEATESMARFAEYLASIDMYGDTAEGRAIAIKNAAEVTVDFSRHGRIGKVVNAFAPYWNPGIQGMAKIYRSLRFPGEGKKVKGAKVAWEATKTLGKGAILFGVVPRLLQMAVLSLFGGEDEWEELSDRVKDTYFLIPKKDENGNPTGEFWKIPYNRDWGAIFGSTFSRIIQGAKGREDNWRDYWDSVIAGNFSIKPNIIILTQIEELWKNEDFAGRSIVPYSIENGDVLREEAYTDDTSWFGKMLAKTPIGKALNLTPIEFDYLISSYLGDYGDMLIEATDADGINGLKGLFSDVIGNSFSADAAYSSLTMTRYYDMVDGLAQEVGTAKYKDPDTYKDTFGYEVQRAIDANYGELITELNQQIRETEDEDEKRLLKFQLQSVARQALDFYDRCMNGEIEDPVLYLTYEPYGDAIRDELIRLDEYNGEDYDYTFVPNPVAPKIGDHKNTDEEKAAYVDIYNRHYTEQVGSVMASLEYQNADDEQKLNYLEEARELAYYYSKQEFAQEFGIESETYDPDDATHVYDDLMDAGFTFFEAYEVEQKYKEIRDNKAYQNANVRVTEYNRWIDNHRDWTAVQKKVVRDAYNFTQTQVAEPEKYDALTDTYNLSPDKAASVVSALSGKDYTSAQRNSKIVSMSGLSNEEKYNTLKSYYDTESGASRRKKIEAAQNAGIPAQTYVNVWQGMSALESDKDKNGETIRLSLKNKRAEYLRDATGLTDAQKNLIWQEYYNSENERPDGWRYRYR